MADKTLTEEFSDFSSNLHLTDIPDSWSPALKKHYVQQGDFSAGAAKRINALGVAVYALQQTLAAHSEGVQEAVGSADQVSQAFALLTESISHQMSEHQIAIQQMQQQVYTILLAVGKG